MNVIERKIEISFIDTKTDQININQVNRKIGTFENIFFSHNESRES